MITFLLGLPGSGKSYYAVDRIYNNFSVYDEAKRDKKVTFKNCYTNINQFKYDKVKNVSVLDFEKLHEILKRLHSFTKGKKKKDDNYLRKFCSRCKIKDTLFVIDEAHNYFDKKDLVLVWWLSYHRHLHHEIILITQNLSLIESKYKAFSEFFYVAKPTSLKLFKSDFKYNVFTHSRLSKASNVGSKKIKKNDKVFALYHSGDSISTSNMVLKYILIGLAIFIALILFIYFYVLDNSSAVEDVTSPGNKNVTELLNSSVTDRRNKSVIHQEDYFNDYKDLILLTFSCSTNYCSYKDITIPFQLLKKFHSEKQLILLHEIQINRNLTIYYLNSSKEFYEYLSPTKVKNEKFKNKNNGSVVPNSFFSSSK